MYKSNLSKTRYLGFLTIFILMVIEACMLSASIFPTIKGSEFFFGYTFSKTESFNQTLFIYLLSGILLLSIMYLISRFMNVSISKGNILLAILLVLNIYCFAIGINTPLLQTTKFWIIKEHLSLLQILQNLKREDEIKLYWVMLCFTFLVPALKMIVMSCDIFMSRAKGKKNFIVSLLSKWAMLDVLVIGILVASMKSNSGIVEMATGAGLTFFVASIILSLIISTCLPYTKNN
jgi:paraquat-inducible protein A